jgi:hypothetical protein
MVHSVLTWGSQYFFADNLEGQITKQGIIAMTADRIFRVSHNNIPWKQHCCFIFPFKT